MIHTRTHTHRGSVPLTHRLIIDYVTHTHTVVDTHTGHRHISVCVPYNRMGCSSWLWPTFLLAGAPFPFSLRWGEIFVSALLFRWRNGSDWPFLYIFFNLHRLRQSTTTVVLDRYSNYTAHVQCLHEQSWILTGILSFYYLNECKIRLCDVITCLPNEPIGTGRGESRCFMEATKWLITGRDAGNSDVFQHKIWRQLLHYTAPKRILSDKSIEFFYKVMNMRELVFNTPIMSITFKLELQNLSRLWIVVRICVKLSLKID